MSVGISANWGKAIKLDKALQAQRAAAAAPEAPPALPEIVIAILQAARKAQGVDRRPEVERRQGTSATGGGSAAMVTGNPGGLSSGSPGSMASGIPGSLASLGATLLG